ncbi:hypothetical protein GCM10023149_09090 [Mucilaginibacter gynuensis]|uniref:Sugar phosphate isomerase/epimerase n=1 Tax=Mucilaginibacter gynuensis TaxID=1302236 RepID=A0ABP8FY73_9SPHI
MQIKFFSPLWGHEHLPISDYLDLIKSAGYNGIETWMPANATDKRVLFDYLQQHEMEIISFQHEADGSTFDEFKASYLKNLHACAEPQPILINSHTGRDYFSLSQNMELIDIATEFTEKTGILVVHETHRGRAGYSPQVAKEMFDINKDFMITADFSHWVCVTTSMLQNFQETIAEAINRAPHIHARVGFEEGPQIGDPREPAWKYALDTFLQWWDKIVEINAASNSDVLTITTEFGPPPYMQLQPFTDRPLYNQFDINCYMKDLLTERYSQYIA